MKRTSSCFVPKWILLRVCVCVGVCTNEIINLAANRCSDCTQPSKQNIQQKSHFVSWFESNHVEMKHFNKCLWSLYIDPTAFFYTRAVLFYLWLACVNHSIVVIVVLGAKNKHLTCCLLSTYLLHWSSTGQPEERKVQWARMNLLFDIRCFSCGCFVKQTAGIRAHTAVCEQ